MAMAASHGAMTIVHSDILTAHCCGERASSSGGDGVVGSGRGAAVRTRTTARMGRRSASFGCPSAEAGAVSSTCCRMQRMTIFTSSSSSSSSGINSCRQEALRSRQSDVANGGEADAMAEEEAVGSFWDRLQQAWFVLIGAPSEAQTTKKRFSRLLVRDRGFNSANLSILYNVAKGAMKEHVELEGDDDAEVTAVVDRLGELRLDFRVKRVKSVLMDEPFSLSVLPEMDPGFAVSRDQFWEDSRAPHDSEVRVGGASFPDSILPDVEPSLSINGEQLWEYSRAPLDLKARLGIALDRPSRNSDVPDVEPSLSISGNQLWEDSRAPEDLEVHIEGALDEPFPSDVLPDMEPSLSISADELWDDGKAKQDLEVDEGRASNFKSTTLGGVLDEPIAYPVLADMEPSLSISGDKLWKDNRASQDLEDDAGGVFSFTSTIDVDSDGEWYIFSFTDAKVEQGTDAAQVDGDLDKQL